MTCHGEWFKDVKDLKTLGYVEIQIILHIPLHKLTRWTIIKRFISSGFEEKNKWVKLN
jgi:hypothetical protein